jgi:hypothetical protein
VQNRHLSVGTLSVYVILEGVEYLFEGVFTACLAMGHLPYVAVGSAAQETFDLESGQNMTLNFFAHLF